MLATSSFRNAAGSAITQLVMTGHACRQEEITMLARSGIAMVKGEAGGVRPAMGMLVDAANRYAAWFHELDAWTQYWDIYRPETRGRYHFGNGTTEPGLLRRFVEHEQ